MGFLDNEGLKYFWQGVERYIDIPVRAMTQLEYNSLSESEKMKYLSIIIDSNENNEGSLDTLSGVPNKIITIWNGMVEDIPEGWALCDGQNDTPNLQDLFIEGKQTELKDIELANIVKLNENGIPTDFYIAGHNYWESLNGEGRTLLVRKDCYDSRKWSDYNINTYNGSKIDNWLNNTYKKFLDTDIQSAIGTTKFKVAVGNGDTTQELLSRSIFLPDDLDPIAFGGVAGKIAYLNGSPTIWWTRKPVTINNTTDKVYVISTEGTQGTSSCTSTRGSRPAFTLPSTTYVLSDGTITLKEQDASLLPYKLCYIQKI